MACLIGVHCKPDTSPTPADDIDICYRQEAITFQEKLRFNCVSCPLCTVTKLHCHKNYVFVKRNLSSEISSFTDIKC